MPNNFETARRSAAPHVIVIANRIDELKVSRNFFAGLVGLNTAELSRYLSGAKPLPNELAGKFTVVIDTLSSLIERAHPLKLNFSPDSAVVWGRILHDFAEQKLLVSVVDLNAAPKHVEESARVLNEWAGGLAALAGKI
jgi:hypothetical protein